MSYPNLHTVIDELVELTFDAQETKTEYAEGACEITLTALTAAPVGNISPEHHIEIIQAVFTAVNYFELRSELHKIGGDDEETSV